MQHEMTPGAPLANLTIRKLDPTVKERLRVRAAQHGHSMEEEARRILGEVLTDKAEPASAFDRLRRHFADIGGVDLELPPRLPGREPPSFE
jgi:antitoxin FitA